VIYTNWIHRLLRGHSVCREVIGHDKYGFDIVRGCEICKLTHYTQYMRDRHNEGICPKQLAGYWRECKGGVRNGVQYGECGND
jgi:hypothetical protein